jgi:membrane protein
MKPKELLDLFKAAFEGWGEDKASRMAAALAYFAIFSIGPLLLVMIAIVGAVLGQQAAQGQVVGAISSQVGEQSATVIQDAIKNASKPGTSIIAGVIGIVTLLLGASGIFGQLQDSLNTIWKIPKKKGGGIAAAIKDKLLLFLMVLGCGVLLLASFLASAIIAIVGRFIGDTIPGGAILLQAINLAVSLAVTTLLFAVLFKVLPSTKVAWKDVWIGGAITALLFILGQIGLSFYLGLSNVGSPYGVAGSLVVLLVWIYYSALIFFFGAEFTYAYAHHHGSRAEAKEGKKAGLRRRASVRESPWFA